MGFFSDALRRAQGLPTEGDIREALDGLRAQIVMLNMTAMQLDR